jgi:hypothetical protein
MRLLSSNLLAWIVTLLGIGFGVLGVVLGYSVQNTASTLLPQSLASYYAGAAAAIAYASIGLIIKVRRAGPVIGWLFIGIGFVAGFSNGTWAYSALSFSRGESVGPLPFAEVAWVGNTTLPSAWYGLTTALALLFPDGRLLGRRWRVVLAASIVAGALLIVSIAIAPGVMSFYPFASNPHAASGALGTAALAGEAIFLAAMTLLAVVSLWSVVERYRQSGTIERQQLEWFAWAVSLVVIAGAVEIVVVGPWASVSPVASDLSWIIFAFATVLVPIAALIAITKYRLYEIDRLISRTFVYGALTALLAGLYTASIKLFTSLFVGVTGQSSDGALILTTLVLATSFTPLKVRLEHIADERLRPARGPTASLVPVMAGASVSSGAGLGGSPGIGPTPAAAAAPTGLPDDLERRIQEIARAAARETLESELARGEPSRRPRRARPRRPTSAP